MALDAQYLRDLFQSLVVRIHLSLATASDTQSSGKLGRALLSSLSHRLHIQPTAGPHHTQHTPQTTPSFHHFMYSVQFFMLALCLYLAVFVCLSVVVKEVEVAFSEEHVSVLLDVRGRAGDSSVPAGADRSFQLVTDPSSLTPWCLLLACHSVCLLPSVPH
ncbi:unnamed protein product [Coregonus sp. 'balchen']|nr:unnamed protein product [Coregonus sp. 'balchen']